MMPAWHHSNSETRRSLDYIYAKNSRGVCFAHLMEKCHLAPGLMRKSCVLYIREIIYYNERFLSDLVRKHKKIVRHFSLCVFMLLLK